MKITVLQPPPFEPVTLAEVHKHLRLDLDGSPASHPDDDMLQRLIATARGQVESMARRSLVQRTLRLSVEAFGDAVRLVRPPVLRVESVTYFDTSNVLQVLDPATYFVTDDEVPELLMANGASAPSTYSRPDALRIEYVAGYAPDGSPATTQADYAEIGRAHV